jgi:hypothetical protein
MKLSGVGVRRLLLARTDDDVDKSSVVNDALARSSLWAFLLLLLGNLRSLTADFTGTSERTVNFSHYILRLCT